MIQKKIGWAVALSTLPLWLGACTPTVKVDTDKPITINLNVNIKHEIRVKVEKDLDEVLSKDSGLF
ncbi:MAG TPA: YnbE family lipoprotein [Spongiibacteraceae bacterium]|nr:YnbE family lipoprotein [Spongiibacteraceae bacterium]